MSDKLVTVGRYESAAEAEVAHATLTEEDIPAFVEEGLAATALPGTAVKLQVPEERARMALRVLGKVERHRLRRLPPTSAPPAERRATHALLLACVALILFPVLILLRAFAVFLFETRVTDLLRIRAIGPLLTLPILFSLLSVGLLVSLVRERAAMTEEGRRYVRDAWEYNLVVLGTALAGFALLWVGGTFLIPPQRAVE